MNLNISEIPARHRRRAYRNRNRLVPADEWSRRRVAALPRVRADLFAIGGALRKMEGR